MAAPAVVLLSGGLDSATALAVAKRDGFTPYALSILYGQRHSVEIDCARRVAASAEAADHIFAEVNLRLFGGSALTADVDVPKHNSLGELDHSAIPVTYVPARNTIFLSLALAYAETLGANHIYAGMNALDYSGYPDCRPEYIAAYEAMARLATVAGISGTPPQIHSPLIELTKGEIITLGTELGVDYSLTFSCYDPQPGPTACGHCDSCLLRLKGFAEARLSDPIAYVGR